VRSASVNSGKRPQARRLPQQGAKTLHSIRRRRATTSTSEAPVYGASRFRSQRHRASSAVGEPEPANARQRSAASIVRQTEQSSLNNRSFQPKERTAAVTLRSLRRSRSRSLVNVQTDNQIRDRHRHWFPTPDAPLYSNYSIAATKAQQAAPRDEGACVCMSPLVAGASQSTRRDGAIERKRARPPFGMVHNRRRIVPPDDNAATLLFSIRHRPGRMNVAVWNRFQFW